MFRTRERELYQLDILNSCKMKHYKIYFAGGPKIVRTKRRFSLRVFKISDQFRLISCQILNRSFQNIENDMKFY